MAALLLVASGLLFRAYERVRHVDPGFRSGSRPDLHGRAAGGELRRRRRHGWRQEGQCVLGSADGALRDASRRRGRRARELSAARLPLGQLLRARRSAAAQAGRNQSRGPAAARVAGLLQGDGHPPAERPLPRRIRMPPATVTSRSSTKRSRSTFWPGVGRPGRQTFQECRQPEGAMDHGRRRRRRRQALRARAADAARHLLSGDASAGSTR